MKTYHSPDKWLTWIDELSDRNYVVIDEFIDEPLYRTIRSFFTVRLELFRQAGIGTLVDHQIKRSIRGDLTYWLEAKRDVELDAFWDLLRETMQQLNRTCFLSLSGYEFHLANYPAGAHYDRHLDQFSERSNRIISLIIYLNENWLPGDGGELEIVTDSGEVVRVEPIARRAVMFKSSEVLHGVLEAHKSRYSLTGWLLYHPGVVGQLLG